MEDVFSVIQAIVPDIQEVFSLRISILHELEHASHRIGRKALAESMSYGINL